MTTMKSKKAFSVLTTVFVLRTHVWSKGVERMHYSMVRDLPIGSVYVMFDETNHKCPSVLKMLDHGLIRISDSTVRKMNPLHQSSYVSVESGLMYLFEKFLDANIRFEHLMMIEYDVRCSGNWMDTLSKQQGQPYMDFGATHVEPYDVKTNGNWHYWKHPGWMINPDTVMTDSCSSSFELGQPASIQRWWKCFMPICLFSYRFLKRFYKYYYGHVTAFCELLFPTLAVNEKLIVGNLSMDMFAPFEPKGYTFHPPMTEKQYNRLLKELKETTMTTVDGKKSHSILRGGHIFYHPVKD